MDQFYIIGIVVFGVIGCLLAILHYKSQGKLNEEIAETIEDSAEKAISIAKDFLEIVDLGKTEKSIHTVLNIIGDLVPYVANSLDPKSDKKQTSVDVVNAILGELKITTTEDQHKLIKLVIDNSIRRIEKNKK